MVSDKIVVCLSDEREMVRIKTKLQMNLGLNHTCRRECDAFATEHCMLSLFWYLATDSELLAS